MKSNIALSLVAVLVCSTSLVARSVAPQELQVFSAQVHRIDYAKATEDVKQKISNEYNKRVQLAGILADKLKMDPEYNYAVETLTLDLWSKRLAETIKPTEQEIQFAYAKRNDLKVATAYKLRHIVLKEEALTDEIVNKLLKENKNDRVTLFSKYVQNNSLDLKTKTVDGNMGWMDASSLTPNTYVLLKDKSVGDVLKLAGGKDIFELVMIDDIRPEHPATFDEAKVFLINMLKKEKIENIAKEILNAAEKSKVVKPAIPAQAVVKSPIPKPAVVKPLVPINIVKPVSGVNGK